MLFEASGSSTVLSEDANVLLALLSFFSTLDKVPVNMLVRGASPRRRWTTKGTIEEVRVADLMPELGCLLLDTQRLNKAFSELVLLSALSENTDKTYTIARDIADRVHNSLPTPQLSFWRHQALLILYGSIPWKNVEPSLPNVTLFLPHLRHALETFQTNVDQLAADTKTDAILTISEAFRFPGMKWKQFAAEQASSLAHGLKDQYVHSCIAQAHCILARIAGDMTAANRLCDVPQGGSATTDRRMHSAIGLTTIQRALNSIQVDDLIAAEELLQEWSPLEGDPSPMEDVVLFRKNMMLGKIMRFQGKFHESLEYLEKARKTAEGRKCLSFDEDLRGFTCELAGTLQELDRPKSAETLLRAEIARLDQKGSFSGKSSLELCLAEVLFAQGQFKEAERLALVINTRADLLKLDKLRLHITRAKICHIASNNEDALHHWNEAMKAVAKFQLTNGGTTRAILLSICDVLRSQGEIKLENRSLEQVRSLVKTARPGGVQYWIAGLRHWLQYLESRDRSRKAKAQEFPSARDGRG